MTSPSGGTTPDAARFEPLDNVTVTIHGGIDDDGDFYAESSGYYLYGGPAGPILSPDDLAALFAAEVTPRQPAPAPYTEPRKGDRVLIAREPLEGVIAFRTPTLRVGEPFLSGADGTDYLDCDSFAHAMAEGRVRLVKAAAPTYEVAGIYQNRDVTAVYLPDVGPGGAPFRDVVAGDWHVPGDGWVPCDVVPREATA